MKRKVVLLALISSLTMISSVALADEVAQLKPNGKTVITYRGKPVTLDKPTTVSLKPGDQICVTSGKLDVVRANQKQKMTLEKGRCLQVAPPRSDGQSVMSFVESLINNPKSFDQQGAMSRSADCQDCVGPALHVPADFGLAELRFPVAGRPNPKTLRLLDATGKTLFQTQTAEDEAVFAIPTAPLLKSVRLEVRNASNEVLYGASVYIVKSLEKTPTNPVEAARRLLATNNIGYVPAVYSYLVKANQTDGMTKLAEYIRASFIGN
jgi:hypothetical protein